jgi:hypothetical protein
MKRLMALALMVGSVGANLTPLAQAAEYQGKNIDGQRWAAKAYSYETGGVFDIQVEFQKKRATMYFVNGSRKTIRLKRAEITDHKNIVGWSLGVVNIGGILGIGISQDNGNREPPRPRPFEGLWRIMLNGSELQSSQLKNGLTSICSVIQ